MHIHHKAACRA